MKGANQIQRLFGIHGYLWNTVTDTYGESMAHKLFSLRTRRTIRILMYYVFIYHVSPSSASVKHQVTKTITFGENTKNDKKESLCLRYIIYRCRQALISEI